MVAPIVAAALALAVPPASGFAPIGVGPSGGTVWQGRILPSPRPSVVYLPPGFSRDRRYPVAYLLHGMPGDPYGFAGALRLARQADGLIARGAQPFIAVAPAGGPNARYRGEWAGPWERYVVSVVVPWADSALPTISTAEGRTIAGLSAGGFGAVDIALRHPGLFGTVESWGGYFTPFRDGPLRAATPAQLAAHDPQLLVRRSAARLRRTRFFLSSGPTHGDVLQSGTAAFGAELTRLRIPHVTLLLRTRRADWRAQMTAGLRYAFAGS